MTKQEQRKKAIARRRARYAANPERYKDRWQEGRKLPKNRAKRRARNRKRNKLRREALGLPLIAHTKEEQRKKRRTRSRAHYAANPERYKERRQRLEWKKYKAQRIAEKKKDPAFKLSHNVSKRMRHALKGNKASRHWETLVSYSLQELREHLEHRFLAGMIWNNYGEWHIDHIIPKSLWQYTNSEDSEFQQCWALANLQPLWAYDNLKKGNKNI